jgi:hypothetical protein
MRPWTASSLPERPTHQAADHDAVQQARAYGIGMVLATQNPVDIDYKVPTNAGTWFIGRLQTKNDKSGSGGPHRGLKGAVTPRHGDLGAALRPYAP